MAYQALYRKWRPQTFLDVLGQEAVVRTLRHQVASGRVSHAYLFCGCRGTGKTSIAKIMSRAVNCLHPDDGNPCGTCETCRSILNETTMDVVEMDAASHSRVEEMRDLLDRVMYPPQFGKYKVYIIDEVHMLSASAFNALLKTLEEPPAYVIFILATTEPQKLPATILSRVQRYDFGRISPQHMVGRMAQALQDIQITADDEALQIVARSAEGAMRDAFSILDMCVAAAQGNHISAAEVRRLLGASNPEFLFAFFDAIAQNNPAVLMRMIDELIRSGRDAQVFLKEIGAHARALITVNAVTDDACTLLGISAEEEKRLRTQATLFTNEALLRMLNLFMKAEGDMRFASTPRIGLESAVLQACEQNRAEDTHALLERIAELEKKLGQLETKLADGAFVSKPAKHAPTKESAPTAAAEPQEKPLPKTNREFWQAFLTEVKRSSAPLFSLLSKVKMQSLTDDTLTCHVQPGETTFMSVLSKPNHVDLLSGIASGLCGRSVRFTLINPLQQTAQQAIHEAAGESERLLLDVFDRESIQITEGDFV